MNVISLIIGAERYFFMFDDTPASRRELYKTLFRFASDPSLSFDRHDALVMAKRAAKLMEQKV